MQKLIIGVLAVTTLVLGVLCLNRSQELQAIRRQARAAEESLRAEADSHKADTARVKELERSQARLERQVEDFTKVTANLRQSEAAQSSNMTAMAQKLSSTGAPGSAEVKGGALGKGMGEMISKMMKDPAMRDMLRGQQKVAINMMYSGLYKDLKLAPEEKEKLSTLLTDAQMRNIEGAQSMFGGETKDATALDDQKKAADAAKKQTDAEIKALLGDDRFTAYEDYQKNIGERLQVDQLKARLGAENMPLQDDQAGKLLQIMKEEKAAVPPVIPSDASQNPANFKALMTSENLDKQGQWVEDYNQRVLARAAEVLTPDQLKQYQDFQDQQSSIQKLALKMARDMFGKDSPAPVPAAAR